MAEAIIVKDVRSPERLLDETALFLHRVEANLPEQKRQILEQLHESDPVLAGKKALIVDDDMRNIYALTSLLERHKMNVLYAESGADGIEQLRRQSRHRRRPDGRDDAGDGRLRSDAPHPRRWTSTRTCR